MRGSYFWVLVLQFVWLYLLDEAETQAYTSATPFLDPAGSTEAFPATSRLRVAVCLYGVVGRSIRWTWPTIDSQVILPLEKAGCHVTIYMFNMQVGRSRVDNNFLDAGAHRIIQSPAGRNIIYEEENQHGQVVSNAVLNKTRNPKFVMYTTNSTNINALRKMYSEMRVGRFLRQNLMSFDVAIATSADYGFPLPISFATVWAAARSLEDEVYLGSHLITGRIDIDDGFYLGRPGILAKFMMRFNEVPASWHDYAEVRGKNRRTHTVIFETILRQSLQHYNITIRQAPVAFYKVRSDGWLQLVGQWFQGKQPWMSEESRTLILAELFKFKLNTPLLPGVNASLERELDHPLMLTKPAAALIKAEGMCNYRGELRGIHPSKRSHLVKCGDTRETVNILELKIAKLEQLVRLKDSKISKLQAALNRQGES